MSKIIYLLVFGSALAISAIFYNIYQPTNFGEKKITIPVVEKIKDAKPVAIEDDKTQNKIEKNQLSIHHQKALRFCCNLRHNYYQICLFQKKIRKK